MRWYQRIYYEAFHGFFRSLNWILPKKDIPGLKKNPCWLNNVSKTIPQDDAETYLRILNTTDAALGCHCIIIIPRKEGHRYFSKLPQPFIEAAILDTAIHFKKDTN